MSDTITSLDDLVATTCPACGVRFGMPRGMRDARRETKNEFWCPNGHSMTFTEGEVDRLQRQVDRLKQREAMFADRERDLINAKAIADAARLKAERRITKISKRISHGVCPDCNRTFANVAKHMITKHRKCEATT